MGKEGEAQLGTSGFTYETGININYGKGTWRSVQSVVDLFQNHLDANTSVYERELLRLIGVKQYDSSNKEQQEKVSILNKIKYSVDQGENEKYYSELQSLGVETPLMSLQEKLNEINYPLPKVKLKVTNGEDSDLVEYDQVKKLSAEWSVGGFHVEDRGLGFDHRLLGIMGGTTKCENSGKRGGLGEGLKMSVTHLKRAGADVLLSSRNRDQSWTSVAKIDAGLIMFEGRAQARAGLEDTGSLTQVDFASESFDPKAREEIVAALDPRKGEGLGKYILEFRDPRFLEVINSSREISSLSVPGGRVYVKGLLVEEIEDLLWSYNLGEKWAIGGRDRSKVERDALMSSIRGVVESIETPEQIGEIVTLVNDKNHLELEVLDRSLQLDDAKKELWMQAIEKKYNFSPGKQLFSSDQLPSDQIRLLEDRVFEVISLPTERTNVIGFFEGLYPGQMVSFGQFKRKREEEEVIPFRKRIKVDDGGTEEVGFQKDCPERSEVGNVLEGYRDTFTSMITEMQAIRGYFEPDNCLRLSRVKFAQENGQINFESGSSFEYVAGKDTLYVREENVGEDFTTKADMYVQMLKVATGKDTFDTKSQYMLTQMAGDAVARSRPELLTEFRLSGFQGKSKFEISMSYPDEQRRKDSEIVASYRYFDPKVNTPNIARDEIEEALSHVRDVVRLSSDNKNYREDIHDVIVDMIYETGDVLHYDGKLYLIDSNSLQLKEVKPGNYVVKILELDKLSYVIAKREMAYLPIEMQDRESIRLSLSADSDNEGMIVLKKRGNKISGMKVFDGEVEVLKRGESFDCGENFEVILYKDLLGIKNNSEDRGIRVRKEEFRPYEQLEESNRRKEFVSSNIDKDYGSNVWKDAKRILLDAMQNHIDAGRGQVPEVSYTVVNGEGYVLRVSKDDLKKMGDEWNIVGIEVTDQGEGYPTPYLTRLGSTTKVDEDLGKFGEGLKMLSASCLRQGIRLELGSRDWTAEPEVREQTVIDYEGGGANRTFNLFGYKLRWKDQSQVGSRTSFSLISLEPEQELLTPEDLERLKLMLISGADKREMWNEWIEVIDPRKVDEFGQSGLDRYFLTDEGPAHTDGVVNVLMNSAGRVYEKGLFIPGDISRKMMFGYNLDETIIDTRERNSFNQKILDRYLADFFKNLKDVVVMRRILEVAKKNPQIDFYEYEFLSVDPDDEINEEDEITKILWKQTYYDMYGNGAILSLRPELNWIDRKMAQSFEDNQDHRKLNFRKEILEPAVENEDHLENENLQTLPEALTRFFSPLVYTSANDLEALKCADLELPSEDKEKIDKFVKAANEKVLSVIESLKSSPEKSNYLDKVVKPEVLKGRMENLSRMPVENVRIKPSSFNVYGKFEEQDGQAVVYINQDILSDPKRLLDTYVHEVGHYLSGQDDYRIGFQRFLMALAVSQEK